MLAHFYHVYADGAWQVPLAEHLAALEASGLGAALDHKAAGVVGSPANCQAAIAALGPGWQIAVTADSGHEDVTLRALRAFAALDGKVFYAHTKGAGNPSRANTFWRRRMTACCAGRWEQAVAALDAGFDAAGPHWMTAWDYWECASPPWRAWFAGNFWWANLSWLRRLPAPGGGDRYAAERWIGDGAAPVVLDLLPGRPLDGLDGWAPDDDEETDAPAVARHARRRLRPAGLHVADRERGAGAVPAGYGPGRAGGRVGVRLLGRDHGPGRR
jgi:hypothetical protein